MKPQNYNNNYPQRRLNAVEQFFLYCSGADLRVLLKPNDNIWGEHPKYVSIGAIILFTAGFAFISMSYAIYSIFNNALVAILIGVLWGSFIFSLDRLLVSSIRKTKYNKKDNEFLNEIIRSGIDLLKSAPRLVLAVFIGVVIAIPLELKLFEKEILNQIEKEYKKEFTNSLIETTEHIKKLNLFLQDLHLKNYEEIKYNEHKRDSLQKANKAENITLNKLDIDKKTERANVQNRIESNNKAINRYEEDIKRLNADTIIRNQIEKQIKEHEEKISKSSTVDIRNGLLARLQALQNLIDAPQNKASRNVYWGVILLIIIIEIMPVLLKIITGRGIYDDKVDQFYMQQSIENRGNEVAEALILKVYDEFDRGMNLLVGNLQQISRANPAQRTFIENFIAAIKATIDTIKNNIDKLLK
ncbi:DUF4407 domain-containing protein [Sphingobacteriales bacterium UPWRP_1]|nr:hypothetical protein BVG80_17850 [Sphingobacteriales bacterium TSM_CSM]PSJ74058.1 DUF4407 domain-containing protein [Sphingobacteriales bacterium UPWRP_1]